MNGKAKKYITMLLAVLVITLVCAWVAKGNIPEISQSAGAGEDAAVLVSSMSDEISEVKQNPWGTMRLKAVGDVMLARNVAKYIQKEGISYPVSHMADWLADADVTMGNLESPLSTAGTPILGKGICFRGDPASVKVLTQSGFDLMTIANNHAVDYDSPALLETIRVLKGQGIVVIGGGEDIQRAKKPAIMETNGVKIACLGYTEMADIFWDPSYPRRMRATESVPGVAPLEKESILSDIAAVRDEADVVVVTLHWGVEYQEQPETYQREMAKAFIDAGADVIIGHHPHCIQGVETYKNGIIFYSLGNFIFDQDWSLQTRQGLALEMTVSALGWQNAALVPIISSEGQPKPAEGADAQAILNLLDKVSAPFATEIEVKDGKAYIKGAEES